MIDDRSTANPLFDYSAPPLTDGDHPVFHVAATGVLAPENRPDSQLLLNEATTLIWRQSAEALRWGQPGDWLKAGRRATGHAVDRHPNQRRMRSCAAFGGRGILQSPVTNDIPEIIAAGQAVKQIARPTTDLAIDVFVQGTLGGNGILHAVARRPDSTPIGVLHVQRMVWLRPSHTPSQPFELFYLPVAMLAWTDPRYRAEAILLLADALHSIIAKDIDALVGSIPKQQSPHAQLICGADFFQRGEDNIALLFEAAKTAVLGAEGAITNGDNRQAFPGCCGIVVCPPHSFFPEAIADYVALANTAPSSQTPS
jgi:hypothetical protein